MKSAMAAALDEKARSRLGWNLSGEGDASHLRGAGIRWRWAVGSASSPDLGWPCLWLKSSWAATREGCRLAQVAKLCRAARGWLACFGIRHLSASREKTNCASSWRPRLLRPLLLQHCARLPDPCGHPRGQRQGRSGCCLSRCRCCLDLCNGMELEPCRLRWLELCS